MTLLHSHKLLAGAESFIAAYPRVTIYSAYMKIDALKALNTARNVTRIIVRWELRDLVLGVSDFEEIYAYCRQENIALFRHTNLHAKVLWDGSDNLILGSANVTQNGFGMRQGANLELNGVFESVDLDTRMYLERIIQDAEYMSEERFQSLKNRVQSAEPHEVPEYPDHELVIDKFLINQLPMVKSPERLYEIMVERELCESSEEQSCLAHDSVLYRVKGHRDKEKFMAELAQSFNTHPFIVRFKEAVRTSEDHRRPDRNGTMSFGAVKSWFQRNTTTVPVPRRWELESYVGTLYNWVCYFDHQYTWSVPGAKSQVIKFEALA